MLVTVTPQQSAGKESRLDIVFLRALRIETVIGVWEWERHTRQFVSLDLEMATDARRAAETDSIEDALNYEQVAKRVVEYVENARFTLVESLAENVARIIVTEHRVPWVRVSVAKPGAIDGSKEVGVVIERNTGDYG